MTEKTDIRHGDESEHVTVSMKGCSLGSQSDKREVRSGRRTVRPWLPPHVKPALAAKAAKGIPLAATGLDMCLRPSMRVGPTREEQPNGAECRGASTLVEESK
eukprot:5073761-Amphidinium_carterae.1